MQQILGERESQILSSFISQDGPVLDAKCAKFPVGDEMPGEIMR